MTLSVTEIGRVTGAYRSQTRIAELNRQNPVHTVQGQVDRVTISEKARQYQRAAGPNISPPLSSPQAGEEF